MADSTAMTVDFLRARLLSERSVSRAAKERADQLAKRVAELEEQVQAVTAQRRQAERAATEVLGILESHGFGGNLSDVLDSGSEHDGEEDDDPRDGRSDGDTAGSRGEEQPPAQCEAAEDALSGTAEPGGGLSWKGRSPKYRMGQSCRKNKRKELSQKGQQDGSDCTDDGQADMDGEDTGGQYVIRYEKDGEMERVLERQAELIGQYEAEEEAQRQWEKQFNENRSSAKVHVEAENKACQIENGWEQSKEHARLADQAVHCNEEAKPGVKNHPSASNNRSAGLLLNDSLPESHASGQEAAADQRDAHEEHHDHCHAQSQGSSNVAGTMTGKNQEQGNENPDGCSSYCDIKAPSDGSPSMSDATLNSKVSDWSSSSFHDHGDNQVDAGPDQQPTSNMDIESVLQALQLARISLSQKLSKPVPPSQVTLALPAPGDDEHSEDDGYSPVDDEFTSARDELCSSSQSPEQEILALPAPEDYHDRENLPVNDDATISLTEEQTSSSPHRQEILALPAPVDDYHREIVDDIKIPICIAGLFRLPTDSFPKDETLSTCSICLISLHKPEEDRIIHVLLDSIPLEYSVGEVLHRYIRALVDFICDCKKYQQRPTRRRSRSLRTHHPMPQLPPPPPTCPGAVPVAWSGWGMTLENDPSSVLWWPCRHPPRHPCHCSWSLRTCHPVSRPTPPPPPCPSIASSR
ncbi:hypothetical protein DAI22_04g284800 [Oryza sativa Japonica Group]|nr:hypothetical protein DAI22_04g284800 [Oryza sativa Japonica Group]